MITLPEAYIQRMREMLGDEADAFLSSYGQSPRRALRVNPLKVNATEFERIAPFPLEQIPWVENGYFYPEEVRPAQHPYYRAGLYYLQEASAMTPADRLPVHPGERVLDLCAAPGGKATQLAGRLFLTQMTGRSIDPGTQDVLSEPQMTGCGGDPRMAGGLSETAAEAAGRGLLVANEISNSRAKALLRNLELFGAQDCFVTNEHARRLAEAFPLYFDKILVDAPCSGEGMFRRQPEVASVWSPERVRELAELQRGILEEAVKMLRPGGMMLYATCTFSPEENEGTVAHFLRHHPEMELTGIEPYEGFAEGRPEWADISDPDGAASGDREQCSGTDFCAEDLKKCVRIWPHRMAGEGHFLALMKKRICASDAGGQEQSVYRKMGRAARSRRETESDGQSGKRARGNSRGAHELCGRGRERRKGMQEGGKRRRESQRDVQDPYEIFRQFLEETGIRLPAYRADRLDCRGGRLYIVPELPHSVAGLHFIRNGLFLGEVRKDRFEPSQPFALALSAADCSPDAVISFPADDPHLAQFLGGQTMASDEAYVKTGVKGWKLVCADRYGLGWVRYAGGRFKNRLPVSWRNEPR